MNRRDFLHHAMRVTWLAGASSASAGVLASVAPQTVRVGVIGAGQRGSGLARVAGKVPGLEIQGFCDPLPFRRREVEKAFGQAVSITADYRALLDDKRVDAVIIATPFSSHAKIAEAALDAGKHVYCEKTLAYGIDANRRLVEYARARPQQIFHCGHQFRSSRMYQQVVDLVRAGEIGPVTHFKAQWHRNSNWRREVPDPKWERQVNWRMYREFSGGLMAELCSHYVDFASLILPEPPQTIMGTGSVNYWRDGRETYDNIQVLTQHANGVTASYSSLLSNALSRRRIEIVGQAGTIVIGTSSAWLFPEKSAKKTDGMKGTLVDGVSGATPQGTRQDGIQLPVTDDSPTLFALQEFYRSIIDKKQPSSNVETGARTGVIVQLALDAMRENRVVRWQNNYNF